MKTFKNTLLITLLLSLCLFSSTQISQQKAFALSGSEFNARRIIDDVVFFNKNAMSQSEIQTFLNSKVPVCDTNGTQPYAGTTRAAYSIALGHNLPFTCIKDYTQSVPSMTSDSYCSGSISAGVKTAAQIIYDISQACGVSPKVLIVLLQKEQGLITDDWPWETQYAAATGYGCPDTASCDTNFSGFFNQVYYAARQYQRYAKQSGSYNFRAGVTSNIQYSPNVACGSSSVAIQNQATAGLYNYTPYQPNQAALNNLYGTGDGCSAYGNRNFWRTFSDWFGSTQGTGVILNKSLETNQLSPGTTMNAGDYIVSPNGRFITTMQYDGNFVTYAGNKAVWNSGTSGGYGNYAIFQNDGNLVVYNSNNSPLWWSTTWDVGANSMALGDDGNIRIYADSAQKFTTDNRVNPYAQNNIGTQIASQTRLNAGDYLQSPDGRYSLVMQSNGNLVLYSADGDQIWNSGTAGKAGNYAVMQNDGNFVIYSAYNAPLWWSWSWGNGASTLKLQNDGNLVVYRNSDNAFTWATWSQFNNYQVNNYIGTQIASGTTLHAGDYLRSPDWRYRLVMQEDGNLVVYFVDKYTPIWNSRTWNNAGAYVVMQNDGNLVVYDNSGRTLWNTYTYTQGASVLKMQSDGNLVVYRNSDNWFTWNSFGY